MAEKYPMKRGKLGFTLVEVVVAVAILSFSIFATWRVITSSINSITRQEKRTKALHIGQACLGRLEGEDFSKVVPEEWTITGNPPKYQLSIYKLVEDLNLVDGLEISPDKIFITPDDPNWPISDYDNSDGILVADKDGNPYRKVTSSPPNSGEYNWDPNKLTLTFNSDDQGKEVQIYYRYYHLIDEGSTPRLYKPLYAPLGAHEDGGHNSKTNPYIIKLIDSPVKKEIVSDMQGNVYTHRYVSENVPPPEPDRLWGDDYTINLSKGLISFDNDDPVWITYLPNRDNTDINNDDYQDPIDDSIVGVVQGCFWDISSGTPTTAITPTKRISVTEFWKQEEEIRKVELKTFIQR